MAEPTLVDTTPGPRLVVRAAAMGLTVATVSFALLRVTPGDPVEAILADQATPEAAAALRSELGLDGNVVVQFVRYLGGLVRGDLGESVVSGAPVSRIIRESLTATLWLVLATTLMAFALAVPTGVFLAMRPRSVGSHAFRVLSSFLLSIPGFFLGLLALLLFAVRFGIAPATGFDSSFPAMLRYLWLPAVVLCAQLVPTIARVLRSSVSENLTQEFVEVAVVRGVPRRRFLWHYVVRPSIAPSIALLGFIIGQLLGAAVVIELVFDFPGIGTQLVRAVVTRDYPVVQGIILTFGLIVVFITFLSDLITAVFDPRAAGPR